ncbi:proline-rich protein 1-like [Durio zibethinus]|uniref:Proline-rich protein 1-like n=1 Tax=Durio zibethinus TaxID=66656 RepID=A0A6P5XKH4_DURZI|nr:proline-rich protein 1-like [Durio zibethinus]
MAITRLLFATSLLLCSLLVIASANDYSYDSSKNQPYDYVRKPQGEEKPDQQGTELPDIYPPKPEVLPVGVEGLVLCKSGPKYYPIQGALARITCLAVDDNGYEKPHSVCSGETDAKGYFFATLSPLGLDNDQFTKFTECKAFLESSPLETCNVPVDVNKGISGATLSDFRVLSQKRMKLYSVGPFFFTSEPNSVSNGY